MESKGNFSLRKALSAFNHRNGIGQVGRPSDSGTGKNAREMAELTNAKRAISFEITPEILAVYDIHMKHTVEPGEFEIMAGNSSRIWISRR